MEKKKKKRLIIAIDGPSAAGKSTVAKILAMRLGYVYIDTGAMYRAVGWKAERAGVDPGDEQALDTLCRETEITLESDNSSSRIFVDGREVSEEIRTPEMGMMASAVSQSSAVRARLLELQRALGTGGGVVMDGRDIGTIVFPYADVKFFLDASAEERGRRRYRELKDRDMDVDITQITDEIRKRDRQDSGRDIAPLRRADDAVRIDSSRMDIEDVVKEMLAEVVKRS